MEGFRRICKPLSCRGRVLPWSNSRITPNINPLSLEFLGRLRQEVAGGFVEPSAASRSSSTHSTPYLLKHYHTGVPGLAKRRSPFMTRENETLQKVMERGRKSGQPIVSRTPHYSSTYHSSKGRPSSPRTAGTSSRTNREGSRGDRRKPREASVTGWHR